jgi:hypothetical protein
MVYIFVCCIVVKTLKLKYPLLLMQKTCLFSVQIVMPLTNALKSIGYTHIVMFLTVGKSDIYQHKRYVSQQQILIPNIRMWEK